MRFLLILGLLLATYGKARSQQSRHVVDSIMNTLRALPEDTLKIKALAGAAQWLHSRVHDERTETALLEQALALASRLRYPRGMVKIYNLIGVGKREHSAYVEAVEMHEKALGIAQVLRDSVLIASSLNSIGVAYRRLDENQKAFEYHFKALRIAEKCGNVRNVTIAINSIGNIQLALENHRAAIKDFEQSLAMEKKVSNDLGIAINLANLGAAYEGLQQWDRAIRYYKQSLFYNKRIGSNTGMVICYNALGVVYRKKKDYGRALVYFREALAINGEVDDRINIADNYISIGRLFLQMRRHDSAIAYSRKGLSIAQEIRSKSLALKALQTLSDAFSEKKDYPAAYGFLQEAAAYQDSLYNDQASPRFAKMQALYELDRKDNRIKLLEQANQIKELRMNRNRYLALAAPVILLLTLVAGFFYIRHRNIQSHRNVLQYELRSLRSQMDPHFIFNCLNSIHRYIWSNQQEEASEYLIKFSKLMRMILENSQNTSVLLSRELQSLELYLELEALRCNHKFTYAIEVDPGVQSDEVLVPSLIIQPFVENAIWHGLVHRETCGLLHIKLSLKEGLLWCVVEDNGIGRKKAMEIKSRKIDGVAHQSLGIKMTENRIKLLQEISGNRQASVKVEDLLNATGEPGGTRVIIHMPVDLLF